MKTQVEIIKSATWLDSDNFKAGDRGFIDGYVCSNGIIYAMVITEDKRLFAVDLDNLKIL